MIISLIMYAGKFDQSPEQVTLTKQWKNTKNTDETMRKENATAKSNTREEEGWAEAI